MTATHSVTLIREMPQKPRTPLKEQLTYLVGRAQKGGWEWVRADKSQREEGGKIVLEATLHFTKSGGRGGPEATARQWAKIQEGLARRGGSGKFNKYPWKIAGANAPVQAGAGGALPQGVHSALAPSRVLTIADLREKFPHELLEPASVSDALIEAHPAFQGIYGRAPQIRTGLSAIWTFIESEGQRPSHILYHGLPACAKTQILLGIERLFGPGCALKLDSTSTTRAGLEKLIFKDLPEVPPFIFMEEIEKANEEALRMWLGAMDDRREFRKVNFRTVMVRQVNFIGFATANDKDKLDRMMGGKPGDPGALSSRFHHQLECPRPDEEMLRRILIRDLTKVHGREEWVEPCLALARQLGTNDPRKVLAFLDGRDRLLNGEYQRDILAIYRRGQP